jgi:protein-S-isoprenylcysteine O-methyltransferase Ste14
MTDNLDPVTQLNRVIQLRKRKGQMTTSTPSRKITARDLVSFIVISAVFALFPLLIVGRWDWWPGWVYAAVMLLSTIASRGLAARRNPGILAERANSLNAQGIKEWDKKLVPFAGMIGPLLTLIISGLDVHFGWSPALPGWIPLAALAVLVLASVLGDWAFIENQFFSGTVRIQTDRGHYVIDTGPYRYVRHPGYVSAIWTFLSIPVLFGSLWGLIPAIFTFALFIVRTALEDKTLQAELPGYKEFTQRTKYRLFPGIW